MDLISICDDVKKLEMYINYAQMEIKEMVESWNLSGVSIIDLIDELPF